MEAWIIDAVRTPRGRGKADGGLHNVRVIRHDAVEVIDAMVPENSLAGIHVYFPDPWPKKRHHKRRLLLIRQYRFSAGQRIWEVVAGRIDPGEGPLDAARRGLELEDHLVREPGDHRGRDAEVAVLDDPVREQPSLVVDAASSSLTAAAATLAVRHDVANERPPGGGRGRRQKRGRQAQGQPDMRLARATVA